MDSKRYFCQGCEKELAPEEKPCPHCGSSKRTTKVSIEAKAKARVRFRVRKMLSGVKKFIVEVLQGWFPSKDTGKFPEGVQKERLIDREQNIYEEKVTDASTGEIVRNVKEKLTDHKKSSPIKRG